MPQTGLQIFVPGYGIRCRITVGTEIRRPSWIKISHNLFFPCVWLWSWASQLKPRWFRQFMFHFSNGIRRIPKVMTGLHEKTIYLSYFAHLRESRGASEEILKTQASTAGDLYRELRKRHNFRVPEDSLRVSVNDAFSSWHTRLKTGDRVAFIPPVSGG